MAAWAATSLRPWCGGAPLAAPRKPGRSQGQPETCGCPSCGAPRQTCARVACALCASSTDALHVVREVGQICLKCEGGRASETPAGFLPPDSGQHRIRPAPRNPFPSHQTAFVGHVSRSERCEADAGYAFGRPPPHSDRGPVFPTAPIDLRSRSPRVVNFLASETPVFVDVADS